MEETRCFTQHTLKGLIFMALGAIVLMQTWGWFAKWLPHVISLAALALFLYGAFMLDLHHKIMRFIKKLF